MATENKSNTNKKRKQFLPHNRPVKKKGAYPLHPGVEGFFITCDGGRERQASHEAINVIDSFYEELAHGKTTATCVNLKELASKPVNKKIKFSYSDDDSEEEKQEGEVGVTESKSVACESNGDKNPENEKAKPDVLNDTSQGKPTKEEVSNKEEVGKDDKEVAKVDEPELPSKKQCLEEDVPKSCVVRDKVETKSIDRLIEDEVKELGDKNKRRFGSLDSGCNGVVFVQMRRKEGDPTPKEIVQHMLTSAAASRKQISRFMLRVLPVEVACYASEEEISKAMEMLVARYFPAETQNPQKFAVLYEARANSGIDRMKIIDAVAKSVPAPHKVDLSNPELTITVQIARTVCLLGVVDKYKELAKYNLRQLTTEKQ